MCWSLKFLLAIVAVNCFPGALLSQTPQSCAGRIIPVSVSEHGTVINNLPSDAFRAKFRGHPVNISPSTFPVSNRIVVLLDVSGSVTQSQSEWELARRVAGDIISTANSGRIALLFFGDSIVAGLDFTHTPSEIFNKLRLLEQSGVAAPKGHGRTALFDAALQALRALGQPSPGDVIYAITDGGDDASRANDDKVIRAFLDSGVRFFAFVLHNRYFATEEERLGPTVLSRMSFSTGGATLDTSYDLSSDKGRQQLQPLLLRMYQQMNSFYLLQVELPIPVDKKRSWDLEVVDEHGTKRKDLDLYYPRELVPCVTKP